MDQTENKSLIWWNKLTNKSKVKYCSIYFDCSLSINQIKAYITQKNIDDLYQFFKEDRKNDYNKITCDL